MPRKGKKVRSQEVEDVVVRRRPVAVVPRPSKRVVIEHRIITTEPEIEIRKPSTLAQALTERSVAVVKPKTRVVRSVKVKRAA